MRDETARARAPEPGIPKRGALRTRRRARPPPTGRSALSGASHFPGPRGEQGHSGANFETKAGTMLPEVSAEGQIQRNRVIKKNFFSRVQRTPRPPGGKHRDGFPYQRQQHPKRGPKDRIWANSCSFFVPNARPCLFSPSEQTPATSHVEQTFATMAHCHGGAVDSAHSHASTRQKTQSQPQKKFSTKKSRPKSFRAVRVSPAPSDQKTYCHNTSHHLLTQVTSAPKARPYCS